jgi:ADP-heptose:LPS heptosyltransferase
VGLGDEILAAGQAKLLGKTVKIGNGDVRIRNPLYDYIPYIDKSAPDWFIDHGGNRGYIKEVLRPPEYDAEQIIFNMDYKAEPAIIELSELDNDYVIIEPHTKKGAPPGKAWHHYAEVVAACDYNFLQFNSDSLGVDYINTSIVDAARWIAGCRCYIGTEGFLHHLAAAFGKPAVVLFGAYSHPSVTGYDFHTNIWRDVPEERGHRKKTGAMETITPEEVIEALNDCYRGNEHPTASVLG